MLKWAGIIGVVVLVIAGLVVAGVVQVAAGLMKVGLFVVVGLVVALVIGGWMAKRKLTKRN